MKYAFNFYCLGGGRKGNSGWTDIWKCSGKESSQPVWADHPPSWGLWIRISNVWSEPPKLHFVACALCPVCCLHRRICSIIWEQRFELWLDFPSVSSSIYETGPSSPGCPIWSCSPGFWWTKPPLLDHLCLQHIPILSREERTTSLYLLPCSSPCVVCPGAPPTKGREGRVGFSHQLGWFSASLWPWGTVQWVSTGGAECKHRRRQLLLWGAQSAHVTGGNRWHRLTRWYEKRWDNIYKHDRQQSQCMSSQDIVKVFFRHCRRGFGAELSREVVLQMLAGGWSQVWKREWKCSRQSRIFIQIWVIKYIYQGGAW